MKKLLAGGALISAVLWGAPQDIRFPASFEQLASKAEEVVDITLDSSMLGLASGFVSESDPDQKEVKEIIKGLSGIYVRSFEFAKEGEYSDSDVEEIRKQLQAPQWTPIVSVRTKKPGADTAEVFLRKENGKVAGLTVLAAEPKKLTVVHIVGSIDPAALGKLGGNFGIPKTGMAPAEEDEEK